LALAGPAIPPNWLLIRPWQESYWDGRPNATLIRSFRPRGVGSRRIPDKSIRLAKDVFDAKLIRKALLSPQALGSLLSETGRPVVFLLLIFSIPIFGTTAHAIFKQCK
jgi:hypothetical protein